MKTKLITCIAFVFSIAVFSQKTTRADRFFENGDYLNAIPEYQKQLDRKEYSKHVFENLATSYYNTFQFRQAYRYLSNVVKGKFYGKDKTYDNAYNFKIHQVLSALGEYEKALEYLELYKKNLNNTALDKKKAISTIEAFKLKDEDYKIKAVTFNSESAEFGVVKRDSTIYFTSDRSPNSLLSKKYKWTHRPFLNIYKVKVDSLNDPISPYEEISKQINSNLHEGNFCFSANGNTLYLSKSNTERKKKVFDSLKNNAIHLYKSTKDSLGEWSKPQKLTFNNPNYSIEHPTLSADGAKLYFASNMPGGYGDFDIYSVTINSNDEYGIPVNLGSTVNTENREQFPFVSNKGDLFFSSNGHLGLGMMDVFVSKNTDQGFREPINLGAPINSSSDDFSLVYHNETEGFFASNRIKADDNIYSFSQVGEIFPVNYKVKFEVRDAETKEYILNSTASLKNADEELFYEGNLKEGYLDANVLAGAYNFRAEAANYKEQTKLFLVKEKHNETYVIYLHKKAESVVKKEKPLKVEEQTGEQLLQTLLADKVGPPVVEREGKFYFELPPIYFDYDKWNIRADSKKVLDAFALKLDKYKSVYIKISSHTDSRGTESYNQLLSERRAESTRNYLALVGYVNARRMEYQGFGESAPMIDCKGRICTEEEHQNNRRSEFEIVKY